MPTKTKTFRVEVLAWSNGTYGIVISDQPQGIDPVAVFEVQASAQNHVAGLIVAHLLGHDRTHRVYRIS